MGTSLTLFRIAGIELKVHWSFALILIWGAVTYGVTTGNWIAGAAYGVLVILLLFVCVTLHEFGHAVAARRYGVRVPSITLLPIGGVAQLERMPDKPSHELAISLAGPLVNVALVVLLLPLAWAVSALSGAPNAGLNPGAWIERSQGIGISNLLSYLAAVNLVLALFNLLPAFPMDGGRILRALLAMRLPYVRATRIAVVVGRLVAVPLAIWGIASGNILMLLVAFFVYMGGGAERDAVEVRTVLERIPVQKAMVPVMQRLYTSETLQRAVDLIISSYQQDFPVFDLGNRYAGVLTRTRLVDSLRALGPEARVGEALTGMRPMPMLPLGGTLADVWEQMARSGSRVVVIQDGGQFVGLLNVEDITEIVHVMGAAFERTSGPPPATSLPTSLTSDLPPSPPERI